MRRALAVLALFLPLLAGCGNLGYFSQAVGGHLEVMRKARPIDDWLARPDLDPALRRRLETAQRIRRWAVDELGLPDNASYTRYADLGRPYVVWNVFAAPELSLEPQRWCFPFVGCLSYRGYYDRADAEALASRLRAEGRDVYVGGVPAYSTLGWFADPLLNTFIDNSEGDLAGLIFHELAHQVLYVKNDTEFNESFATAVQTAGVERWFAANAQAASDARAKWREESERRRRWQTLLLDARAELDTAYRVGPDDDARRAAKARILNRLAADALALRRAWGWPDPPPGSPAPVYNNARLGAVATYQALVPGFLALLERSGGDFPRFYAAARELSTLEPEARRARLRELAGAAAAKAAPAAVNTQKNGPAPGDSKPSSK